MTYFTLDEAAQYATEQKGFKVEPSVLLRAGVHGDLPICAAFGAGMMYNAATQREEDLTPCMLIIPPKHLLELETEGTATIHLAHSLDGNKILFPEKQRTREHLRVMVAHLDKLLERLIDTTQETNAPAAKVEAEPDASPSGNDKPWLIVNHNDPKPAQHWYIPARYFARQLVKDDSTLLRKKKLLGDKVAASLADVGIFKRGKTQKKLDGSTVLKSFVNVTLK